MSDLQPVNPQLPTDQDEYLALTSEYAERGVSFKAEDQLLPLIYILQNNSPAVEKRGDGYIEGAQPGDFWLRNSLDPIRNGEEGIDTVPVDMIRTWIEWLPNRGGFVARHDAPPADMNSKTIRGDDGRERTVTARANGNLIVDTREFYIMVDSEPFVLPCTSTKHTFARQWQTMFHRFKHPTTGRIMPAFARKYRLTTVPTSNALGKWFGLKFEDLGVSTVEEIRAAIAFSNAIQKGERKAEVPIGGDGTPDEIPF